MIELFGTLLLVVCLLVVVVIRVKFSRINKLMERLPGPKQSWLLGNLSQLMCEDEIFFKRLREWSKEYGPVYNITCLHWPTVNITDAEELELIISSSKHMRKSPVYWLLNRWLGKGLLTSAGSKWKTHRKILASAFHFSILQDFVTVFHRQTDRLVGELMTSKGNQINIVPLAAQLALFAIAETSLGISLDSKNEKDIEYTKSLFKIGKIFYHRVMRPWLYNNTIFYNLSSTGKLEKKLLKFFHEFNNNIVQKRSGEFVEEKTIRNDNADYRKKLVMLDLLLEAKYRHGKYNDKEIQDEVSTFMFAGQDTTSTALCYTLVLLASNKAVQDQVYQEMLQLYGDTKNHLTLTELNDLKYMEMVIKESLRLYPSAPFIARILGEDLVTKQGYLLPKGTNVNIHIFDIHRNPKYWPDPEKFDPERFLPENYSKCHPFAYVPFSAGPRNCLGQKFAILELKAALYGILQNFVVLPVDTPDSLIIVPDLVLRTKEDRIMLRFLPRKNL